MKGFLSVGKKPCRASESSALNDVLQKRTLDPTILQWVKTFPECEHTQRACSWSSTLFTCQLGEPSRAQREPVRVAASPCESTPVAADLAAQSSNMPNQLFDPKEEGQTQLEQRIHVVTKKSIIGWCLFNSTWSWFCPGSPAKVLRHELLHLGHI